MVKINVTKLQRFLDNRYISVQKHPAADLCIYNYTQKAQFDKVWTEETLNNIVTELKNTFANESEAFTIVGNIRKEFALQAKQYTYPHLLFSLLDKKDYQKEIWKLLRPKAEKPFKEET